MSADSPDLVIAKRLLDELKLVGFEFQRTAPGPDGPLLGHRDAGRWVDTLQLRGFSRACCGWRRWKTSLMVADEVLIERRVDGSALTVLREVLSWEKES